jgi:Sulfotransferase family
MPPVGPILIVGPSRSGTELVRAILNGHSHIYISNETHYFDDLRPRLPAGTLSASDREDAFQYFLRLRANAYGYEDKSTDVAVDDEFRMLAENLGESADAIFVAHCRSQEGARGKTVWGEKTPRHLFRSKDILEAFPTAKILVVMRDPRGAIASYKDWNDRWLRRDALEAFSSESIGREVVRVRMSYNLTVIALLWRSAANTASRLKRDLGASRIFVCKFEDLLSDPVMVISDIVKWIGVRYETRMLNVGVVNSSYVGDSAQGIDPTIADRWRARLTPDEIAYIDWLAGPAAARLGYVKSDHDLRPGFALQQLATLPISVIRAIAANRHRIGRIDAFLAARLAGLFK